MNKHIWNSLICAICQLPIWRWDEETSVSVGFNGEGDTYKGKRLQVVGEMLTRQKDHIDFVNPLGVDIFTEISLPPTADARFPTDFYRKDDGRIEDHKAFVIPREGMSPEIAIDGDEIWVPTFKLPNTADLSNNYARDQRVDVFVRMIDVFMKGFEQRIATDQLRLLCAAGGKVQRAESIPHSCFTDMLVEPELMADVKFAVIKKEGFDTREDREHPRVKEINASKHLEYNEIKFHEVPDISDTVNDFTTEEFGVGKKQACIALDLLNRDAFVMPWRDAHIFIDPTLGKNDRQGLYGWIDFGLAVLNGQRVAIFEEKGISKWLHKETGEAPLSEEDRKLREYLKAHEPAPQDFNPALVGNEYLDETGSEKLMRKVYEGLGVPEKLINRTTITTLGDPNSGKPISKEEMEAKIAVPSRLSDPSASKDEFTFPDRSKAHISKKPNASQDGESSCAPQKKRALEYGQTKAVLPIEEQAEAHRSFAAAMERARKAGILDPDPEEVATILAPYSSYREYVDIMFGTGVKFGDVLGENEFERLKKKQHQTSEKVVNAQGCNCASPRCTERNSFHCMHGIR